MLLAFAVLLVLMMLLLTKLKLHAFLALLFVTISLGLIAGLNPSDVVSYTIDGAGKALGYVAFIVLFATIIGEILNKTGSAFAISNSIKRLVGSSRGVLAIALAGFLVAVPVFCNDTAFVMLAPIAQSLILGGGFAAGTVMIALAAGVLTSFNLVFPAGPLYAATTFGADIGKVLALGLFVSVPVFAVGIVWAYRYCNRLKISKKVSSSDEDTKQEHQHLPSTLSSYAPIIIPLGLILFRSLFDGILPQGSIVRTLFDLVGHPIVALLMGIVIALAFASRKNSADILNEWVVNGVKRAAPILVTVGAGGALGKVLEATGLGTYIGRLVLGYGIPSILVPFIVAAALKTAQGSSTVTMITAPSIILPILPSLGLSPVIATMAVCSGAMICTNVNDSFFWVVTGFSDMDTKTGFKALTALSIIQGVVAFVLVAIIGAFFA